MSIGDDSFSDPSYQKGESQPPTLYRLDWGNSQEDPKCKSYTPLSLIHIEGTPVKLSTPKTPSRTEGLGRSPLFLYVSFLVQDTERGTSIKILVGLHKHRRTHTRTCAHVDLHQISKDFEFLRNPL